MASGRLMIPVKVDLEEVEKLISELKGLQTYKLAEGDEKILVDSDDVIKIFFNHLKAERISEQKAGKWIAIKSNGKVIEYRCSECGRTVYDDAGYDASVDYPYCHCGCKMEVVG